MAMSFEVRTPHVSGIDLASFGAPEGGGLFLQKVLTKDLGR